MLRRSLYLAAAAGLVAATIVAFASASRTAPSRSGVTPETPNAWLPAGLIPAGHDWETTGGDLAGSSFSTLKQINTSNVARLKMVWQKTYNGPGQGYPKPENRPIVLSGADKNLPLATGTMFLPTNQGVVALNPENGDIVWQYKGALEKGGAATPGSQEGIGRSIAYGRGAIFAG